MILALSQEADDTVEHVFDILAQRGAECLRFDTFDFPLRSRLVASASTTHAWNAVIEREDGPSIDLAKVETIWYRRPLPFDLPEQMTRQEARFARSEARFALNGLFQASGARWINSASARVSASYKPLQLSVARQVGLSIPPTLITNGKQSVQEFCAEHDDDVIYKSLQGGVVTDSGAAAVMMKTTPVGGHDLRNAEGVSLAPCLFQRNIQKDVEVRVVVCGPAVFAAQVDSQTDESSRYDWRASMHSWAPHELPGSIADRLRDVVSRLGLVTGVCDLILTPDGDYVFLEVNPDGQWLWLELQTGAPIAAAFCDLLMQHGSAPDWPGPA